MIEFNKWKINNTIPNFREDLDLLLSTEWKNANELYNNLDDNILKYTKDKIDDRGKYGRHNEYICNIGTITLNTTVLNTNKDSFNLYEKIVYDIVENYLQFELGEHDINNFTIEFWNGFNQSHPFNSTNFHFDYSETNALFYNERIGPTFTLLYYVTDCNNTPTFITSINDNKQIPENKECIINYPVKETCISFKGHKNLHGPMCINKNGMNIQPRHTISIQIYDYKFEPLSRPFYSDCLKLTKNTYNRNTQILTLQPFNSILNKTVIKDKKDYHYFIHLFKTLAMNHKHNRDILVFKIQTIINNLNLSNEKTVYFDLNTSPL
jgi:hypothetical protein